MLTFDRPTLPGIVPTLDMDFTDGRYFVGLKKLPVAQVVDFTRASGGGRFNTSGQYEWLPADQPRIDYDPVTGECRGLLIEEQRTNLIPSSDTSGGSWSGGGDRVLGAATGLSGVFAVGASMARDASAMTFNYYQLLAPVAGTTYTFSVFVRFADGRDVGAEFGQPGTENSPLNPFSFIAHGEGPSWAAITKEHIGGGLWRLSYTLTPSDGMRRGWGILIRSTHKEGLPRLFVTGYQIEAGAFPTSYIPTTTAQVTRAADIASVNELSPWYNPEQGAVFVDVTGFKGLYATAFHLTRSTYVGLRMYSQPPGLWRALLNTNDGTGDHIIDRGVSGNRIKAAYAYSSSALSASVNGNAAISTSPPQNMLAPLTLQLGRFNGGSFLNGHIRVLRFYPKRLSDTELQSLTAN